MLPRRTLSVLTCLLFVIPAFANPPTHVARSSAAAAGAGPMRVGMAQTMLAGVPDMFVFILDNRLGTLMKEFTGLEGKLEVGGSPFELADKLKDDKVGLALFQGIEFAWVRERHPELKPLTLVVSQHHNVHAQLIVRKDSSIANLADLSGKELACPKKTKVHSHVFLKHLCAKASGAAPSAFFASIDRPATTEVALDQLLEGRCHAVVADQYDVDFYQRVKPGCFSQCRVLETSDAFPAAVIAYRDGALSEATLKRLRDGLMKANRSERGQDIMAMWQVTEFAPVPAGYLQTLEERAKCYPETVAPGK